MEKALKPYVGMTAKAVFLEVDTDFFHLDTMAQNRLLDERVAAYLLSDTFPDYPKGLHPFPLLGWPTWHQNQDEAFYLDQTYFRPKRIST